MNNTINNNNTDIVQSLLTALPALLAQAMAAQSQQTPPPKEDGTAAAIAKLTEEMQALRQEIAKLRAENEKFAQENAKVAQEMRSSANVWNNRNPGRRANIPAASCKEGRYFENHHRDPSSGANRRRTRGCRPCPNGSWCYRGANSHNHRKPGKHR